MENKLNIEKYNQASSRCATSAPLFAGLFLSFVLGGCSNTKATRIEARDNAVTLPELRMAYNFDHDKQAASPHAGHAIELGVTKTSGSASQALTSGQLPIILDKTTFTAPQQLINDFDLTYRELSWRYREFNYNEGKLGMEISAGLGNALIDLKVSTTTQIASSRVDSYGARAGLGLIYRLSASSSFQARGLVFYSPLHNFGVHDIERYELVYAKAFFDNFRLRVGYAGLHVIGYNLVESDFKLEVSGPVLALDMEF
jgi:hypothetical protein